MLKVIGAGLGRTGTHSLAEALEILGFGPCYTLLDVEKNSGHIDLWWSAIDGKAVDWDELYEGYRSAVEWPTVAFLPAILPNYPDSKVILTQRDPESWYESAAATIFPGLEVSGQHPDPEARERSRLKRQLILDGVFKGRYRDREFVIATYLKHMRTVIALVPVNRLLHYRVGDGWEPLCRFLDVSVPERPFPYRNRRSEFLASAPEWARAHMQQADNQSGSEADSAAETSSQ